MDPIEIMVALFLNLNFLCSALPADMQRISGIDYQVLNWTCGKKAFQVWQRWCPEGQGFWGRPFYLEELSTGHGFYFDRFGEVHASERVVLNKLSDLYVPRCGS